jgi:hypothetical protein
LTTAAAAVAAASTPIIATSGAGNFVPVRLVIRIAHVARLHKPLKISVRVSADSGVLDTRTARLRVEARLATECGGSFQTTPGVRLLNQILRPQPRTGAAYTAAARGTGRPTSYGVKTVCVYLEEAGDNRVFASDQSVQLNVSRSCTLAAARYDSARRRRASGLGADRRAARRACGSGVAL